jgi:hypothetical protein
MKVLILISICFAGFLAKGQDNVNVKQMVGFGCYYAGQPTKPVIKVTKMVEKKEYKEIASLLRTGNQAEKYLAVITLERLDSMGQYKLTDSELDLISNAKTSDKLVSVCSGCTYFDKVPMKQMLADDNFFGSRNWLDRILKKE